MKTPNLVFVFLIAFYLFSCGKSNNIIPSPPPDPNGTTITDLKINSTVVYDTLNFGLKHLDNNPDTITGLYTSGLGLGLYDNLYLNNYSGGFDYFGVSISNLGLVNGLGSIVSHPTSGFTTAVPGVKGNGYVVKFVDYDPATLKLSRTRYYRLYITDKILGADGNVTGFKIKYQGPF